jgi:asparagine synthase (glutamine-hydrolysing)
MCGIGGILSFDAPPTLATLRAMGHAMAHRGPDGFGHQLLGPCGLTHRRLSIIDLSSAGAQPMSWRDERYWITFNGEIYNYLELRDELRASGVTFRSDSDTEVLLAAYEAWGLDAFPRMNGMWGLGIWDSREQRLVLARDRMGVKPVHYHRDARRLLFASEIKGLLAAEPALAELDPKEVARFLEMPATSFGAKTLFRGVSSLEPGTVMVVDAHGVTRTHRYWTFTPPLRPRAVSIDDASREVQDLLVDAVRLRFRSDVPVGTCLSGGLDSSSIVSIAHQKLGKAPDTFSAIYDQKGFEEGEFISVMERAAGLRAHHVRPDGRDVPEILERATYHQEYPTVGPGVYSQWHVMRIASDHVKVLLDGQGSDEIYGGYHYNLLTAARATLKRLERGQVSALFELIRAQREVRELSGEDVLRALASQRIMPRYKKHVLPWQRRVGRAARRVPGLREILGARAGTAPEVVVPMPPLTTPELHALIASEPPAWNVERVTGDGLTDQLWAELTRTSIPSLLHYEDRDSMAFSIEARTPFLDYRLVEHAFSLPPQHKIYGGTTKYVLREAMRGILPEPIRLRQDKKGYPTPFGLWIRDHHSNWLRELVLSSRALQRGFVREDVVRRTVDEHLAGRDHAWPLFRLATLELFCRRFIDGPFVADAPRSGAVTEAA